MRPPAGAFAAVVRAVTLAAERVRGSRFYPRPRWFGWLRWRNVRCAVCGEVVGRRDGTTERTACTPYGGACVCVDCVARVVEIFPAAVWRARGLEVRRVGPGLKLGHG